MRICLCYADNCPEIYYSVSSVESNQRPNTENKTNTGLGIKAWSPAPALVTSLRSLMAESETLKWSVTSSSASWPCLCIWIYPSRTLRQSRENLGIHLVTGIHDNLVFSSGCDKVRGEWWLLISQWGLRWSCLGPVWSRQVTSEKLLKILLRGQSHRSHNNLLTEPDRGIFSTYEAWIWQKLQFDVWQGIIIAFLKHSFVLESICLVTSR